MTEPESAPYHGLSETAVQLGFGVLTQSVGHFTPGFIWTLVEPV